MSSPASRGILCRSSRVGRRSASREVGVVHGRRRLGACSPPLYREPPGTLPRRTTGLTEERLMGETTNDGRLELRPAGTTSNGAILNELPID